MSLTLAEFLQDFQNTTGVTGNYTIDVKYENRPKKWYYYITWGDYILSYNPILNEYKIFNTRNFLFYDENNSLKAS